MECLPPDIHQYVYRIIHHNYTITVFKELKQRVVHVDCTNETVIACYYFLCCANLRYNISKRYDKVSGNYKGHKILVIWPGLREILKSQYYRLDEKMLASYEL